MTRFTSPLLLACVVTLNVAAHEAAERSDLSLTQRQITVIEQLLDRSRYNAANLKSARYRFDYPKLAEDLKRVRQGIHKYLSPSRAQPADLIELTGDYRTEAPYSSHLHEHD